MKTSLVTNKAIPFQFILLFLLFNSYSIFAQNNKTQDAKLEIEKLTLFKNGLGFVISNTSLPDNAQSIKIGQLPIPTFGTFWVSYPNEVKLNSLVTSMETNEKSIPVQSIAQMLTANAGHKVTLYTNNGNIEGTILVTNDKETQPLQNPYFMSPRQPRDPYNPYNTQPIYENRIINIKTDKGIVALDPGQIFRAEFNDDTPVSVTKSTEKTPSIMMQLEKPANNEKITVSYLAHGVTWSPSYLIDLSNPKTAKFSAHALIINEMTDFNNIKLQLTTGFPNIKFGDVLNPVSKSQSLSEFLKALAGSTDIRIAGSRQSIMSQQAMVSNVAYYDAEEAVVTPSYSTASEGLAAEDLFFYPVDNFSLKKDETAWIPLFSAEMPYKHIYTWKIKDFVDQNEYYRPNPESPDGKFAEEVWHSCRLTNSLNMPLTTAATEFITNGEFTGQDICYYTAPKGETTIRINKALNVLADQAEVEVDRKRDAAVFHGYRYDLVKVRGELKIRNKTDKAINLEISKELSGEVLESSPNCKDVKIAKGLKQVNSKHNLTWNIDLTPGKEENITYQYQVYIRE